MSIGPRLLIFRPVRCPITSTCGFSIAAITRSVGLVPNAAWIDATTQSSPASVSSGTSSVPFARMFTSTPCSSRKGFSFAFSAASSFACAARRPSRR